VDLFLRIVAVIAVVWGIVGFVAFLGAPKHVGLLLDGILYVMAGVASFNFLIWWPLPVAFVGSWILRLVGLDPAWRWWNR